MERNKIAEKVIEKIKEKNIKPKPRWSFLVKDYFVWSVGLLSLLVGGLASSVFIYASRHSGWREYMYVSDSLTSFILLNLPYFWIILLILFIFVADYNIKHTKKGYRYRLPLVVIASIFLSLILGVFFYNIGIGRKIDDVLSYRVPLYDKIIYPGMHMWQNPDKGALLGQILSVEAKKTFTFSDIDGRVWRVDYTDARLSSFVDIEPEAVLRILGETKHPNIKAEFIGPVGAGRGFIDRHMMPGRMMNNPDFHQRMMQNHLWP